MSSWAYYNEFDNYPAEWLCRLINAGLIPAGVVDRRSIADVHPDDLKGFAQCHFFAGIGGWPQALRLAGWPDDRPCWTGSPPCQPFSVAGAGLGFSDERDLWPVFASLISKRLPPVIFGEQVAAAIGKHWLDRMRADLEAQGYAVGAFVLPACAVDGPHRRDRVWTVASGGSALGDDQREGLEGYARHGDEPRGRAQQDRPTTSAGVCGAVVDSDSDRRESRGGAPTSAGHRDSARATAWSDFRWVLCHDRKARRVQPGIQPLGNGFPARVGRLRAYGNAIVPPLAAEVVKSYMEIDYEQRG